MCLCKCAGEAASTPKKAVRIGRMRLPSLPIRHLLNCVGVECGQMGMLNSYPSPKATLQWPCEWCSSSPNPEVCLPCLGHPQRLEKLSLLPA